MSLDRRVMQDVLDFNQNYLFFPFFFIFFGELGCCGISSLMSTDSLTLTILFIRESGLCCVSGLCATFQSNFVYARNIVGFSKDATSRHVIMLIN